MINKHVIVAFYAGLIFAITGCQSSDSTTSAVSGNPANGQQPSSGNVPVGDGLTNNSGQTPVGSGGLALDSDYRDLLTSIAGGPLENLAIDVVLIGDAVPSSAINSVVLEGGTYPLEDQSQSIDLPVSRQLFTCELGGELTLEFAELAINEEFYSRDSLFTHYTFNQCRLAGQGEQVLDGSLQTVMTNISGRHFTLRQRQNTWTAFSWIQGMGLTIEADAVLSVNEFSSFSIDQSRQVVINDYSKHSSDQLIDQLSNVSFLQTSSTSANSAEQEYTMNAQGTVIGEAGIAVEVITDPIFYSRQSTSDSLALESIPFSGQLAMNADDRSQLVLSATQGGTTTDLYVSVAYQDTSGLTRELSAQRLSDLPYLVP